MASCTWGLHGLQYLIVHHSRSVSPGMDLFEVRKRGFDLGVDLRQR
jgi:hypothetical protein